MNYLDPLLFRRATMLVDAFLPPEKPKMKIEDAMAIVRYGYIFQGAKNRKVRETLRAEALAICKQHAEALMQEAEKKAEAERVLVDIQVYATDGNYGEDFRTVHRTFSDGTFTKSQEHAHYANQLKHTFEQGKKAARIEAKTPRSDDCV